MVYTLGQTRSESLGMEQRNDTVNVYHGFYMERVTDRVLSMNY